MDLANVAGPAGDGERFELIRGRIEADDGVAAEITQPHDVAIIDENGVGGRICAGELPLSPPAAFRIIHSKLSRGPFADPDPALRIGPDPPGTLTRGRRLDDGRGSRREIDAGDVVAGQ